MIPTSTSTASYGPYAPIRGRGPRPNSSFPTNVPSPPRVGKALDSLVSQGCIITGVGAQLGDIATNVLTQSFSEVDESVIMDDVIIGRHCRIKKAIIDKHNHLPPGYLQ